MGQPSSDEVMVLELEALGDRCLLALEDGEARSVFELRFEDAGGIRLLVGSDGLTRWLMGRGKLWALSPIRSLVDGAVSGRLPELPYRLANPGGRQ